MQDDNESPDGPRPLADSAWGPKEVGEFLQISPRSVASMVGNHPSFPPPIVLGPRTFRWHPDAVREWLRSQHETRPAVRPERAGRRIVERV